MTISRRDAGSTAAARVASSAVPGRHLLAALLADGKVARLTPSPVERMTGRVDLVLAGGTLVQRPPVSREVDQAAADEPGQLVDGFGDGEPDVDGAGEDGVAGAAGAPATCGWSTAAGSRTGPAGMRVTSELGTSVAFSGG
ncbi:hypothetical protein GCM10027610_090820 [Dactylosporangium cerinum]